MTEKHALMVIDVFNRHNGNHNHDKLLILRLRSLGLTNIQVAGVIEAMDSTCPACYDDDGGCQCWNDE